MAAIPLFTLTLAAPVQAQQFVVTSSAAPRISGFSVDEVRRLEPGVELEFTLYGTPGGRATLSMTGARRNLTLTETEPGQYEGTYTLGRRDKVTAASRVTANLRVDNLVTSGVLGESLLRTRGRADRGRDRDNNGRGRDGRDGRDYAANLPRIERFEVDAADALIPGNELTFALYGTPGAKVDMKIAGTSGTYYMEESATPGRYTSLYTIRRRDKIMSNSAVTATMRLDNRTTTAVLAKPLRTVAAIRPVAAPVRFCANCATITAVNVIEVQGDGNYLGAIGGGAVGAALGSQVGKGSGKTAATIAGAIGGAYIGRNIQRNGNKTQHYEVVIRFDKGGTQTVTYENDPQVRIGEKVLVNNGVLTRAQ
jgi:outer membrane lipoprotein SlyB